MKKFISIVFLLAFVVQVFCGYLMNVDASLMMPETSDHGNMVVDCHADQNHCLNTNLSFSAGTSFTTPQSPGFILALAGKQSLQENNRHISFLMPKAITSLSTFEHSPILRI